MAQKREKGEDEVEALFRLPLDQFTSARNALAARLRKNGHAEQAEQVKSLTKPPVSAWAANQLFWRHREAFQSLLASGAGLAPPHQVHVDVRDDGVARHSRALGEPLRPEETQFLRGV